MRGWYAVCVFLVACGVNDPAPDESVDGDDKADSFDSSAAKKRETAVSAKFAAAVNNPQALATLVGKLPKGGDLHMHLSGAAATESLLRTGQHDHDCVTAKFVAAAGSLCTAATTPLSNASPGSTLWTQIVGNWSMEGFQTAALADRHTHFFDAFGKFGLISRVHTADMLADVRRTAARENISYLEVMISLGSGTGGDLGETYITTGSPWTAATFATARKAILADARIATTISRTRSDLDSWERAEDTALGCGTAGAEPACDVTVRYLVQGTRIASRESVFGQFVYGFALVGADSRVVGVNLVQAEDDSKALANYHDQMVGVGWLVSDAKTRGAPVPVSLHAGELATGFGHASDLKFHVREAVEIGGASRIGHAVDLLGEDDADALLSTMAANHVAVEACLTSNQQLLGVEGASHPAKALMKHYVPVAFATDDEGILRTDMNAEIVRAFTKQALTYRDVKRAIRASLTYSFLPGTRLRDLSACKKSLIAEQVDAGCMKAMMTSERASAEWQLEADLDAFEQSILN
ncbi:MAG: Adenosine deaminase [Myxococcales bacterium]|nr:Adenosine deaminase [Myxococcales bacterium]